jgi:hypothetical protein
MNPGRRRGLAGGVSLLATPCSVIREAPDGIRTVNVTDNAPELPSVGGVMRDPARARLQHEAADGTGRQGCRQRVRKILRGIDRSAC